MTVDCAKGRTARIVEFVFGALFVLSGLSGIAFNPLTGVATLLFGLFLIVCGLQWTVMWQTAKRYDVILSKGAEMTIDHLASAAQEKPNETKENISLLVKKGVLTGVAIDESDRRIIVSSANSSNPGSNPPAPMGSPVMPATKVVKCSGCGAVNEVRSGSTGMCEHCGSALSSD